MNPNYHQLLLAQLLQRAWEKGPQAGEEGCFLSLETETAALKPCSPTCSFLPGLCLLLATIHPSIHSFVHLSIHPIIHPLHQLTNILALHELKSGIFIAGPIGHKQTLEFYSNSNEVLYKGFNLGYLHLI